MRNAFKKNNFIEHSIKGVLLFFKDSVLSEEQASYRGFLQSIDPRVKTITVISLCIAVLVTKNIYALIFLYSFSILLAAISKLNLGFFLKRTWVFIPLFSLFIAIPAVFSFVSPGEALVTFKFIGFNLAITRQGLAGAILFVSRVAASVSLVILLSLSTRQSALLKVLRVLKVPQVFVMVLGMSYRYIYLFMEIVENTYLGIKSRTGALIHYQKGQSIVAWNIATLWQRSFKLNEDVYSAMLSRGYRGEPVLIEEFKTTFKDWVWICFVAIIFIGVIIFRNG
ncbi:MAG: cobalt ECF transporter T component CbiQ [Candidatus Omnitrophota bacterium]|nr:cobalt ECF transporter T component CbiQ [Candidatus Omnitrophota bacterium]